MTEQLLDLIKQERITPETKLLKDWLENNNFGRVEKDVLQLMKSVDAETQSRLAYVMSLAIYESDLHEMMDRWYDMLRGQNRASAINAWWGEPSSSKAGEAAVYLCIKATKSKVAKVRQNAIATLQNQAAWKSDVSLCLNLIPTWAADPDAQVRMMTMCLIGNLAKNKRYNLTDPCQASIRCLTDLSPHVKTYAIFAVSHLAKRYEIKSGIQQLIMAACSGDEDGSMTRDARRAIVNYAKRDKGNSDLCIKEIKSRKVAVEKDKDQLLADLRKATN